MRAPWLMNCLAILGRRQYDESNKSKLQSFQCNIFECRREQTNDWTGVPELRRNRTSSSDPLTVAYYQYKSVRRIKRCTEERLTCSKFRSLMVISVGFALPLRNISLTLRVSPLIQALTISDSRVTTFLKPISPLSIEKLVQLVSHVL